MTHNISGITWFRRWRRGALIAPMLLCMPVASAAEVHAAVATNFAPTLAALAGEFKRVTGHDLLVSSGSTGKLYAQVRNGAPYDVLLAADVERPRLLEQQGAAVAGSRYTYARGELVLWSRDAGRVDAGGEVLRRGDFAHLAIANPRTAPYGAAARQVLERLGLWPGLAGRLVQGEDIGQALQFVETGNAELGFVARAQLLRRTGVPGSAWIVPAALYDPIDQQAVLLVRGRDNPAARALLDFLKTDVARRRLHADGYGTP